MLKVFAAAALLVTFLGTQGVHAQLTGTCSNTTALQAFVDDLDAPFNCRNTGNSILDIITRSCLSQSRAMIEAVGLEDEFERLCAAEANATTVERYCSDSDVGRDDLCDIYEGRLPSGASAPAVTLLVAAVALATALFL